MSNDIEITEGEAVSVTSGKALPDIDPMAYPNGATPLKVEVTPENDGAREIRPLSFDKNPAGDDGLYDFRAVPVEASRPDGSDDADPKDLSAPERADSSKSEMAPATDSKKLQVETVPAVKVSTKPKG